MLSNYTAKSEQSLDLFHGLDKGQTVKAKENVHAILGVLLKRAKADKVTIGVRQLAKESGLARATIQKWMARLIEHHVIKIKSKGIWNLQTTEYEIQRVCHSLYTATTDNQANTLGVISSVHCSGSQSHCSETQKNENERKIEIENKSRSEGSCISEWHTRWTEQDYRRFRKERRDKTRAVNASIGKKLLTTMLEACQSGATPYPVYPDCLKFLQFDDDKQLDFDKKFFEQWGFEWYNYFYDYRQSNGKSYGHIKNLKQPPKEDRPTCMKCGRRMSLTLLKHPFGAVKYVCRNPDKHLNVFRDIWPDYPVFKAVVETTEKEKDDMIIIGQADGKPKPIELDILGMLRTKGLSWTNDYFKNCLGYTNKQINTLFKPVVAGLDEQTKQEIIEAGKKKRPLFSTAFASM